MRIYDWTLICTSLYLLVNYLFIELARELHLQISLVMIMIAKFQRMHNRNTGNIIVGDRQASSYSG